MYNSALAPPSQPWKSSALRATATIPVCRKKKQNYFSPKIQKQAESLQWPQTAHQHQRHQHAAVCTASLWKKHQRQEAGGSVRSSLAPLLKAASFVCEELPLTAWQYKASGRTGVKVKPHSTLKNITRTLLLMHTPNSSATNKVCFN